MPFRPKPVSDKGKIWFRKSQKKLSIQNYGLIKYNLHMYVFFNNKKLTMANASIPTS